MAEESNGGAAFGICECEEVGNALSNVKTVARVLTQIMGSLEADDLYNIADVLFRSVRTLEGAMPVLERVAEANAGKRVAS